MIGIGQMYRASHKISPYGIEGYQIEKKYQVPLKVLKEKNEKESKQDQKKRQTKRGHYLQDYAKVHGDIPGPGVYNYPSGNWVGEIKHRKKSSVIPKKLTYIDQLIQKQKKQKLPAPGQYKLFKDEKQIKADIKRLAHKKINHSQRCTYLDAIQYQASITPGVGSYNTDFQRPKSATMLHRHKNLQSIRPLSFKRKREKKAELGSYDPKQIEDHKSFSKKKKGYHQWGRTQRFRSNKVETNLGPGCYLKAQEDKLVGRKSAKSIYYG